MFTMALSTAWVFPKKDPVSFFLSQTNSKYGFTPSWRDCIMGRYKEQSFGYAIWESIMFMAVLTWLPHLFRERFRGSGLLLCFTAGGVYTVYIIHPTLLIAFNVLSLPLRVGLATLIRRSPYNRRVLG
jgi:hypothetical protein